MTTGQTTVPAGTRRVVAAPFSLARVLFIVGAAMFIIGAFASGGHELASIPYPTWALGALGAWTLALAAQIP